MEPITPNSEKIDLRTKHGRKIYEAWMRIKKNGSFLLVVTRMGSLFSSC